MDALALTASEDDLVSDYKAFQSTVQDKPAHTLTSRQRQEFAN